MADTRYLKRRREGWYFQIAVPRALREAYGSDVITVTLGTRDLTVAQQRRWPKLIEYQEAFGRLSGKVPAETTNRVNSATLAVIDEIALAAYHQALMTMEANARRGKGTRALIDDAGPR